jgi:hypothetical protein
LVARSDRSVTAPDVRKRIEELLVDTMSVAHVASYSDPYQGLGAISADRSTIVATLQLDVTDPLDMPTESAAALIHWAQAASHDGLVVAVNGISIINAEAPPIGSEGIGMVAAASSCC